jgi:hypothetical protein
VPLKFEAPELVLSWSGSAVVGAAGAGAATSEVTLDGHDVAVLRAR